MASPLGLVLAQAPAVEEQLNFYTVVVMWLIHVGFMAYEAGAARRKNIMSTAMKNILTIAVVTPTFYYVGWYVYGCMEEGWPKNGHQSPDALPGFCGATAPWADQMGPNLGDHISLVFFLAFLLFSWTTASIMSGALIERVRLSAFLILSVLLGSAVWIMDAAWGWSAGGWLTTRFGFHGFYAACLVITSTAFPGWLNIYLSMTTLGSIAMVITFGFAGGFTGGWFASKGDPFWTLSGGLAGVISVSAGADVYHPSLAYLLATSGGMLAVYSGTWMERKLRIDDAVGAVAVHGVCGFYGLFLVGIFAGGFPTGVNAVPTSFGGQLMGMLAFFPLAFLPGFLASWGLKKLNLLRVPPEVELEGLDMAEFQQ